MEIINNAVTVRDLTDDKFKTMRVSISFVLPLDKELSSAYALIPSLITRATIEHPTISLLSKHLAELYGASLNSSVSKIGDNQILNIYVSGIADKYALENEDLSGILTDLLCKCVFSPLVDDDGYFEEEAFNQEKRQLIEAMDSDFNEKRIYAKIKCKEIMFENEAAGIRRYGSRENLVNQDRLMLKDLLENLINTARIEIFVLGSCDFDKILLSVKKYFSFERSSTEATNEIKLDVKALKEKTETMKLSQSKIVMGFRTGTLVNDSFATRVMCTLLGGSVSSKLFLNVREKMSLCYYCSSTMDVQKGALFIDSGVETDKIETAKEAILKEVEDIRNGIFSDKDVEYAKLAMLNSYKSVEDSLNYTEVFYLNQIFNEKLLTPKQMEDLVMAVSFDDIVKAAKKLKLDTIYVLKGEQTND